MANRLKKPLIRNCSDCGVEMEYWYKSSYERANENKSKCGSCKQIGKTLSLECRKKMSLAKMGDKNPNKNLENQEKIRNTLIGHNRYKGKQRKQWIEKISLSKMGHEVDQEVRNRIGKSVRKYRLNEIKEKFGISFPNYNPKGCKIIDAYGKKHGYNFQHAENGGEVCIDGYFPDGFDKKKKTIIEIDESKHYDKNGILKPKDKKRQIYLESLGYEVIRIRI